MTRRSEIECTVVTAFPGRPVSRIERLTGGVDFAAYRVDFDKGDSVAFKGQRNHVSYYLGPRDFRLC